MKINKDVLHYFTVGGILCAVGAVSALLIGCVNYLTHDTIVANEKAKQDKLLAEIYPGESVVFGEEKPVTEAPFELKYLKAYWAPTGEENLGYIFKTDGKNSYGQITMLVEIEKDKSVGHISLLNNGQSFASTVQKEYVDKANKNGFEVTDVTCGATYGAKLVKAMAEEAQKYYTEVVING